MALLGDRSGLDIDTMARMQGDVTSMSADWILKHVEDTGGNPASCARGTVASMSGRLRRCTKRSRRRYGVGRLPTRCRRRSTSVFIAMPATSGLPGFMRSSLMPSRRGSTIARQRISLKDARTSRARPPRLPWRRCVSRFGDPSELAMERDPRAEVFAPAVGGGRLLDWFFSRGPVPVAGDSMTVNKTTTNLRRPYETSEAASYRQILDVGAWDRSVAVNTTGQSGHPQARTISIRMGCGGRGAIAPCRSRARRSTAATVSLLELVPQR